MLRRCWAISRRCAEVVHASHCVLRAPVPWLTPSARYCVPASQAIRLASTSTPQALQLLQRLVLFCASKVSVDRCAAIRCVRRVLVGNLAVLPSLALDKVLASASPCPLLPVCVRYSYLHIGVRVRACACVRACVRGAAVGCSAHPKPGARVESLLAGARGDGKDHTAHDSGAVA
jgi:hypothetical protein